MRNRNYSLGPVMLHLTVKAGKPHAPHSTAGGCTLLVLWTDKAATADANLGDFEIAENAVGA